MVHGMPNVRRLGMRVQNMALQNKGLVCNKEVEFKNNLGGILVISSFRNLINGSVSVNYSRIFRNLLNGSVSENYVRMFLKLLNGSVSVNYVRMFLKLLNGSVSINYVRMLIKLLNGSVSVNYVRMFINMTNRGIQNSNFNLLGKKPTVKVLIF